MAGRIPQHFIDDLVGRADIIDVIGSRVTLKKAGKEYKACCPFHDEKSPSFSVVPDKQFYHCFGCGAHGTALGFLMDYDHLSFVEAVEELAARAGLQVPRDEDPNAKPKPTEDLFAPMEKAAELYRQQLRASERAINYLKKRGLTGEIAAQFAIGFAPDSWDFVIKHIGTTDNDARQLHQVGLIIERENRGGYYDRFRDRIMFPIRDSRGRIIGFGGRILDQGEPKYLNSPETELFHKGKELYGLYEARQNTRNLKRLLVVEGYMDVVRLHQSGITYAIATLGTATTPEHLTRIFRVCNEVVFCFDGDRAGRAAAWRALDNALAQVREGRQIRFLFLPDGHDPDSLVGEEGQAAFEARIDQAMTLSDYLIRELSGRFDIKSVDGRAQFSDAAKPLIQKIPHGVYRELLLDALAQVIGMSTERLHTFLLGETLSTASDRHDSSTHSSAHLSPNSRSPTNSPPPSLGRSSLIRQAVHRLVHFPAAAETVNILEDLDQIERPGVALLLELLANLRNAPCSSTGALLERWREKPDYNALAKLAQTECIVADTAQAAAEISGALSKLVDEDKKQRQFNNLLNNGGPMPL